MSPRTGRPKVDDPKDIDVKVRFDKDTNKRLLDYCQKHNVTGAAAIRQGVEILLEQKE